jgi:hypothetical protein
VWLQIYAVFCKDSLYVEQATAILSAKPAISSGSPSLPQVQIAGCGVGDDHVDLAGSVRSGYILSDNLDVSVI